MPTTTISAAIGLPFGLGQVAGEWTPDTSERDASWEMYIELITRVSVADLPIQDGLLSEALSSLYSLFDTTRDILKRYGPSVAQPSGTSTVSFGHFAVAILNLGIRPVLARWHPLLLEYEEKRPAAESRKDWEQAWSLQAELRSVLAELRLTLTAYAGLLGEVCGAKGLLHVVQHTSEVESSEGI